MRVGFVLRSIEVRPVLLYLLDYSIESPEPSSSFVKVFTPPAQPRNPGHAVWVDKAPPLTIQNCHRLGTEREQSPECHYGQRKTQGGFFFFRR